MKKLFRDLMILLVGLTAGLILPAVRAATPSASTMHTGPTLEMVHSLATLVTTNVTVSDVQLTELRGYTGGAKAALIVRGDFDIGTDLAQAKFERADADRKLVFLNLPAPTCGPPRVDLARTQLVTVKSDGLWQVVPGNEAETAVTEMAFGEAQRAVERASRQSDWPDRAKQRAEQVLSTFFSSVGWSVQVHWQPAQA